MRKVLLLQLNVDDPIQGAWFINHNADIIVAHDGKVKAKIFIYSYPLSHIRVQRYLILM